MEEVVLTSEQMRDVQGMISLLSDMEQVVEEALAQSGPKLDSSRINRQLSLHLDRLQSVLHRMQRVTSEGTDDRR